MADTKLRKASDGRRQSMKVQLDITGAGVLRVLLATVFLIAGVTKLPDAGQFAGSIAAYQTGLPSGLIKAAAIVLPWMEILIGLCLLSKWMIRPAALLAVAMLGLFLVLSGTALIRGLEVSCGCFNLSALGFPTSLADWLERPGVVVLRNLLLLGGAIWLTLGLLKEPSYSSAATSST